MTHIVDRRPAGPDPRHSRAAAWMSGVTLAGMIVSVAGALWVWADKDLVARLIAPQVGLAGQPVAVTPAVQLAGLALTAPALGLLIYLLLQARAVFQGFAVGVRFTDLVAVRVARIGWILLAKGLLMPFWRAAASVVLTLGNPSGHRVLAVSVGTDDILWGIVGALLVAIGWTLREAARIAEEHAGFV